MTRERKGRYWFEKKK